MDVVMLAQHGVRNAVATLGTATTPHHVQKLLRSVERVVFAFDGDAAGRRAAWRALEACLPLVADTKRIDFLFLPPEHDPDSFVRERGADGFAQALAAAQSLSEFMLRELSGRVDLDTPEGRARLQAEARPLLRAMPSDVALRLQLVQAVATRVGIRSDDLLRYLDGDTPADGSAQGSSRRRDDPRGGPMGAPGERREQGPRRWREGEQPAGPREGRPGGWGGWGSRWRNDAFPRPMPAALPDLPRRARLLLSLHPALAREPWPTEFVPQAVVDWIARLAALPDGATFGQLVEWLRPDEPELAAALEGEAVADRGLLAELATDEARREFEGALVQMRDQISGLIANGPGLSLRVA
jgi:DNA primase